MSYLQASIGTGGGPVVFTGVTGTPTEIAYFDLAGNGYSDALATRDPITNETYIGYRTSGGDFSNALKLGNFIGSFITDGTGFERHDAVNDNFTFSAAIDGTPISATTNTLLQGYADLTNGVFATGTYNADGAALDYSNNGVYGSIQINNTEASINYGDGTTFGASTIYNTSGIQTTYTNQSTNRQTQFVVNDGFVAGGDRFGSGNDMTFNLDDNTQQFYVKGLKHGGNLGDMLNLNAQFGTMRMGDVTNISSHVKIGVDNSNATAYIDGLASPAPNWTPSTLSDGFTGTGLNDMKYDSTVTYTGSYPNTYTATIATINSVYIPFTSITTPGFTVGDTVTDGASTGTIIAGSDGDGFIIIQPIIDTGWTSATSITDISSGAAASVGGLYYTDTMSWSSTAGGSGIIIPTSSFISLGDGLSVRFVSPTGHTIGDSWEWTMLQGTVYSKMALFDGVNRTMSIGDVEQTANDVRTDWVLGTGKNHGIYEYLGEASNYNVVHDQGPLLKLQFDAGYLNFGIENPASSINVFHVSGDSTGYGAGIGIFDSDGDGHSVFIGDRFGAKNSTLLTVDDDTKTITLAARHISAPLSAYADDADAGTNGVVTGELYQTDGTGSAPLNIAGIVMIKQ